MHLSKDSVLRLLVVDDSVEAAEAIVSGLRNGGIAVRPSRPESEEELATLLSSQPLDLVLAARNAKTLPVATVMRQVAASSKDLPAVVVVDSLDEAALMEALELGARGVALRWRPAAPSARSRPRSAKPSAAATR